MRHKSKDCLLSGWVKVANLAFVQAFKRVRGFLTTFARAVSAGGIGRDATSAPARLREARGASMPPPTGSAEEGGSPPREERVPPPPPPPSASSGGPLSNVTSSLRRAGTQVKRFGRKILADTTSVLPGGFQSKDRGREGQSAHGAAVKRDDDADGADATSPGSKITPRKTNSRPRYLDLGPLDPRKVLQDSLRFADSADPPEGYVNVWQGNFRRWQKRWLAATTPGVLTMHRRASKLGPSVSVDLTAAAVLVNESGKNGVVLEPNSKQKSTSGSSRQFLIVTPDKTYRIRVLHARCRAPWVRCVERSAERLERARALVRSRGKFSISSGGSFGSRNPSGSFGSKPPLAEKRPEKKEKAGRNAKRPEKLDTALDRRASSEYARGAHRRTPSRETFGASSSAESRAAARRALHDAFLSFESNPALHAAREHAEVLASKTLASERTAASSFVGVVGSFMGGGDKEPVEEEEDDEAVLPGAGRPRDVVAAVAALRAAYDSTLSALLERCAAAEEQSTRHQLRSANLAAALAEFTGVVPSPGAAAGEAHVGFGRGPVAGSGQGGGSLSLSLDEAREADAETREVEIVTPGQSGFAAALRGRGGAERDEKNRDQADADGSGSQLSDSASSGASDEYGSVLSFATGVSGGSGVVFGQDDVDDLDLLVAAEVVNRHDFVISRSRALNGELSPAERDETSDDDAISDDDATSVSSGAAEISNSESESEEDDVYGRLPRERLPAPQPLNQSFSIWDLLRKNMGKDLSRISMPANINQPLSLLQRTVEDFEYLDLLYRAIDCDCVETSEKTEQEYGTDTKEKEEKKSTDRVALLALFAASSYASWYGRAQKPFASTLGETFDWTSPDGNVRVVCECVVYDPPVAAFHASGVTPKGTPFVVHGEGMGTSKFYGRYVQVNVKGGLHLELPLTRERYSWSKAAMHVHNVISGRVWVDMVGEVNVIAHPVFGRDASTGEVHVKSGGERASFKLLKGSKPVAGKADTRGALVGGVFDRNGAKTGSISGNCLDALWLERDETYAGDAPLRHVSHESHERGSVSESVRDPSSSDPSAPPDASASGPNDSSKVDSPAWRFGGVARDAARQYGFTKFAISLNELPLEGIRNLPPTDSRFRPDMRALENGDSEEASRAKVRVEDRNRALLAARRKKGEAYAPAWFKKRTRSIKNDGTVPDGFDDLSFTREEPFGGPSSPVSSPASEKSANGETEPVQRKELGSSNPSSPGSSVKSGAAFANGKVAPFGKHVNTLENRTSLWVYKGAYWEQRLTGEYVDPEVVTDERFDVFGLAAAWRAERDRRREKRAVKSEADVPPREDHKR